jgi:hypothetical protein
MLRGLLKAGKFRSFCPFWISDFSELHRELLKTGQGRLANFQTPHVSNGRFTFENPAAQSPLLWKAGRVNFGGFESFQQSMKMKSTVFKTMNI